MNTLADYTEIEHIASLFQQLMYISSPSSTSTKSPVSESADLPCIQTTVQQESDVKLAGVLSELDHEDEGRIFIVRRISKLGHMAKHVLGDFFSQFGPVIRILLLPSRGRGDSRCRPASMGFVVMANASHCAHICSCSGYSVNGVDIQVQKFTRNERVEVTDGRVVAHAYLPAIRPYPERPLEHELSSQHLEMLAKAVIDSLEI